MSSDEESPWLDPGPGRARSKRESISTTGQSTSRLVHQEEENTQFHCVDRWGFSVRTSSPPFDTAPPPRVRPPRRVTSSPIPSSPLPDENHAHSPSPELSLSPPPKLPSSSPPMPGPQSPHPDLASLIPLAMIKVEYASSPPSGAVSNADMEEVDELESFGRGPSPEIVSFEDVDDAMLGGGQMDKEKAWERYEYPPEESQDLNYEYPTEGDDGSTLAVQESGAMEDIASGSSGGGEEDSVLPYINRDALLYPELGCNNAEEEAITLLLINDSQNSPEAELVRREFSQAAATLDPAKRLELIRKVAVKARANAMREARQVEPEVHESDVVEGPNSEAVMRALAEEKLRCDALDRKWDAMGWGRVFEAGELREGFEYHYAVGPEWEIDALADRARPLRRATESAERVRAEVQARKAAREAAVTQEERREEVRRQWEGFLQWKVKQLEAEIEEWKELAGDRVAFKKRARRVLGLVAALSQF
ncbi:hypothetical protein P7C70_g5607, partial [Phenoliferia sp. Uapishka_3]